MLKAPGSGDDSSVRMLINSLARFTSQSNDTSDREYMD